MEINPSEYKILIVDAVPSNVLLLKVLLANEQFMIATAGSGQQALEQVEKEAPDLILLDVVMPDMSGFEVARHLKSEPKTVIRNLLSNAVKFSKEGSEVLVKMEEVDGRAVVSVQDHGCGISEEGQKKLLHTDTHFSTFGTNNEEGAGLGLLLCQDFVVKNGGELWFTSKEGEGSTFCFSIPKK